MGYSFIVVDDGDLDRYVVKRIINLAFPDAEISDFGDAKTLLENIHIRSHGLTENSCVILIDLNMPVMSGFQFLEKFDELPAEIKNIYSINVLSSSKNQSDINRMSGCGFVDNFIEKPLNKEKFLSLMDKVHIKANK